MLRLEPTPLVLANFDKGKGHVFYFEAQSLQNQVGLKDAQD